MMVLGCVDQAFPLSGHGEVEVLSGTKDMHSHRITDKKKTVMFPLSGF